jgi:hypothetical protein
LPDGERIVYKRTFAEFVVIDLQGLPQAAWQVPAVWDDARPTLSPDGTSLLYSTSTATHALDLTTGATSQVAPGYGAVISPDGQWIAYSDADDSLLVGPVGGVPTLVLGRGGLASWLPDSRSLVFVRYEGGEQTDLVLANRDGDGRPDRRPKPNGTTRFAGWSGGRVRSLAGREPPGRPLDPGDSAIGREPDNLDVDEARLSVTRGRCSARTIWRRRARPVASAAKNRAGGGLPAVEPPPILRGTRIQRATP